MFLNPVNFAMKKKQLLPPGYLTREQREKRLRQWAIDLTMKIHDDK